MLTEADKAALNEVYRNSKTGMGAIHSIIGKVYDDDLALDLNRQAYQYAKIGERASNKLYENGCKPEEESPLNKAKMWGAIQMNTLTDISTEHIATPGRPCVLINVFSPTDTCTNSVPSK